MQHFFSLPWGKLQKYNMESKSEHKFVVLNGAGHNVRHHQRKYDRAWRVHVGEIKITKCDLSLAAGHFACGLLSSA